MSPEDYNNEYNTLKHIVVQNGLHYPRIIIDSFIHKRENKKVSAKNNGDFVSIDYVNSLNFTLK